MALTDYIGIRGAIGPEPFQGIGGGGALTLEDTATDTPADTDAPDDGYTFDDSFGLDGLSTANDLPELFKRAFFYQDGDTLQSVLRAAWLYQDPGSDVVKSVLSTALLYVKNADGKEFLESVLNDRLSDLAYVDATLDFGFLRVLIKGKMIEYAK